jgi:magnesium transporter
MTTQLDELVRGDDLKALKAAVEAMSSLDIAAQLERLEPDQRAVVFRLLRKNRALAVFEHLDPAHQEELLSRLRAGRVRDLLEQMDPDDRARLLDEMPAGIASRLLAGLSERERQMTAELLGYAEGTAGRIMSPEWVSLQPTMTIGDALERVREVGASAETVYVLPVTDESRRLIGTAELRDLVLARPGTTVDELMRVDPYSVTAVERQEAAARLMAEADLLALPVVDSERRLLGVITVDDAMEILEAEETEDMARAGGTEPLGRPYFGVSALGLARARVVWLLILIIAATLTVNVLAYFEETLDAVVTLALFVPLLIGTGGNTGSQAATMVVRALAVGEVHFADLPRVVRREFVTGVVLGGMLALLAFVPVALIFDAQIATIVSLTLVSICTLATFLGAMLPMLAKRVGIDPAVISAPLITTLVDATGLVMYFLIANAVLNL